MRFIWNAMGSLAISMCILTWLKCAEEHGAALFCLGYVSTNCNECEWNWLQRIGKHLDGFNMFILLFDIDASHRYRCHPYCLIWLWICGLLINCCGFGCSVEVSSMKIDPTTVAAAAVEPDSPGSATIISPSSVLKQAKPSSVIYIPSLDGMNA